jgi:hypothetical protein
MRKFQVRDKDSRGRPTSKWHTVYANSEEEAISKHLGSPGPGSYWDIQPKGKKSKNPFYDFGFKL